MMYELNLVNKNLWFGVGSHTIWFDLDNYFSVDIGKWFLRIFIKIKNWSFCRYIGIIRCG